MISIMSKTDSVARILALAGGNGGGGTTGTTNYLELANKPMINGVELVGNKTAEDLGIEAGVSEETLIQTIAQESAARQKQDELLQGEIETKITPANIKPGEGVSIEQSGLDVIVSATLSNYLSKNNEAEYTPTGDYNPATKKYVDDSTSDKITINDIPTELPNPESLTIQVNGANLDTYDGSEAKTVNIEIPDVATPDWSISDPEDPSYIKNRTHYSTTNITNVYDDNATRMNLSRGANGINWYVAQINTASAGVDFSQVDIINLTLGEAEYTNVVKNSVTVDDNGVQTEVYYFGNQLAMSSFSPYEGAIDTGESFTILVDSNVILVCLRTENTSGYAYTNIKLDAVVSETVHKLDNKYLDILKDSTISTETGYSSFKIEESLAQLDNKYVTLEDKSINITWDGNTTDRVVSTPVGLYKVSDNVYNGVDLLGASVSLSDGTTVEVTEFLENNTPATVIAIDNARVVIIRQANYKDNEGYTYPETGVYFSHISSIYVNSFTKLDVQEIGGTKNFVGEVTVNEPVQDTNPATKKYVDDSTNNIIDDSKSSLTKTYSSSKIESLSGVKVLTGTNEKPIIANDLSIGTYVISGVVQSSQSNITNITVPKKLYSVDKTDLGAAIWYENPKTSQQTYYEFRLEGNEAPTEKLQTYVTTEYLSSATLDGGTWI